MPKAWEWGLVIAIWLLAVIAASYSLWGYVIILAALAGISTYLNIEPLLMRHKIVKRSILDDILR